MERTCHGHNQMGDYEMVFIADFECFIGLMLPRGNAVHEPNENPLLTLATGTPDVLGCHCLLAGTRVMYVVRFVGML